MFNFIQSKWNKNKDRLYPSAPLENKDLEQRLEKNDVNSFNIHMNNIKEMISSFNDKNNNSKRNSKNIKH